MFPDFGYPAEIAGAVTAKAAAQTGLREGTAVVFGGGDQPVQALGNGLLKPGTGTLTLGSGGQLLFPLADFSYDGQLRTHTFNNIQPHSWYAMGAVLNCGLALRWCVKDILNLSDFKEGDRLASAVEAGSGGLFFLPYLTGDRTPHMNGKASGMFFGLRLNHTPGHMVRSVMEGITMSLKDAYACLGDIGATGDRIIATGGGAGSRLWMQMIADIFDKDVQRSLMVEQAGIGAAILAGVGTGLFPSLDDGASRFVRLSETIVHPEPSARDGYSRFYEKFKDLYRTIEPMF